MGRQLGWVPKGDFFQSAHSSAVASDAESKIHTARGPPKMVPGNSVPVKVVGRGTFPGAMGRKAFLSIYENFIIRCDHVEQSDIKTLVSKYLIEPYSI